MTAPVNLVSGVCIDCHGDPTDTVVVTMGKVLCGGSYSDEVCHGDAASDRILSSV